MYGAPTRRQAPRRVAGDTGRKRSISRRVEGERDADSAPPHFHAYYGDEAAVFSIETGEILEGRLPPVARRLVREWTLRYRDELRENWRRVRPGVRAPLQKIPGLDAEND
jgi:Domain of unknown function (DUF4160)